MGKTTCWSCGTSYDGLSCPVCAVKKEMRKQTEEAERIHKEDREHYSREQEANREAIQEAAFRTEEAAAYAAEERRRTAAESWRLQAESKAKRAYDLYKARMYDEAVDLAKQSIGEDPGNIAPYMFAAWALEAGGSQVEASWYYQKQIELLRTPEYSKSPNTTLRVLKGLPDDDSLTRKFSAVLHENSTRWAISPETVQLLDALVEQNFLTDARFLMESLLSKVAKLSLSSDLTALGNKLIDRGLLTDAGFLIESLTAKTNRLLPRVYLIEMGERFGKPRAEALQYFLQSISFDGRGQILEDLRTVMTDKQRFSPSTIAQVRKSLSARYEQWRPDISATARQAALKNANKDDSIKEHCRSASLMTPVKLGALTWLGSLFGAVYAVHILGGVQQANAGTALWILFIGSFLLGCLAAKIRKDRVVQRIAKMDMEASERAELELWVPLIG
jgi:uncharacterized Zn finger protein (UPF0148 family)